jgi:hypothetical protein
MRKIFFDLFVNPYQMGVYKEKNFYQLFETFMVPACPGWVLLFYGITKRSRTAPTGCARSAGVIMFLRI